MSAADQFFARSYYDWSQGNNVLEILDNSCAIVRYAPPNYTELSGGGIAFVNSNTRWVVPGTDNPIYYTGQALNSGGGYYFIPAPAPPAPVCFLEGTKVLTLIDGKESYVPIETLRNGSMVKTSRDGYMRVELVAKGPIQNPETTERIKDRLYKCSTSKYPELTEDLYITGCHSILVDKLTEEEQAAITEHLGKVYVTDRKYRLIAAADLRAEPWASQGTHTIWHFALESDDPLRNYGIYVNGGLLVETCSIQHLRDKTEMEIIQQ